jgi:hypothetical protein
VHTRLQHVAACCGGHSVDTRLQQEFVVAACHVSPTDLLLLLLLL